jgi:hypothetical protein
MTVVTETRPSDPRFDELGLDVVFSLLPRLRQCLLSEFVCRLSFRCVADFVPDGLKRLVVNRDEFDLMFILNDTELLAVFLRTGTATRLNPCSLNNGSSLWRH